jgi:hypothetical protein
MRDHITEDLLVHVNQKLAFSVQSALDALDTSDQVKAFLLGLAATVTGNALGVFINETSPHPLLKKLTYVQQVQVMVSTVAMILTSDDQTLDMSDTQMISDMLAAARELSGGVDIQVMRGLRPHGTS